MYTYENSKMKPTNTEKGGGGKEGWEYNGERTCSST
jgi:hypothetical protein